MNENTKREPRKVEPGPGEYIEDGLRMCSVCRKPRERRLMLGTFEKIFHEYCDCQQEEKKEAEERQRREEEQQRQEEARKRKREFQRTMQEMQEQYRLSDKYYKRFRFEKDDSPDTQVARMCRSYVEKWDEVEQNSLGILFYGSVGTGKSFYACSIANELLEREVSAAITSVPRVLNLLQGERERQKFLDHLQDYRLLVIDDLGAERDSSYAAEQVYQVIDARARAGLPLIITTNCTMEELKNPSSMSLKRIYDRVLELCPIAIRMTGESRRAEHKVERLKLAKELLQEGGAQTPKADLEENAV